MASAARERKFRDELDGWLTALRRRDRASTAGTYEPSCRTFLELTHGELTRGSIDRYLVDLEAKGLGAATRARNISAVRSFLQHCMQIGLVPWCPIDALGLERPKQIKSDPGLRTMQTSELQAVFAASQRLGDKERAVIWLFATTGIRVTELCRARWSDLRLDEVTGRMALHVESLKRGQDRNVEIVPGLFELLAHLHGSPKLSSKDARPLITYNHTKHYTRSGIHRMLERIISEAGIDRDVRNISALWFRHSTFSLEARTRPGGESGANAYQIRQQAGHQRIETSQHYVDLGRGLLDSPTHLLPNWLLGEGYTKPESQ